MSEMKRRADAAQATLKAFKDKPFKFGRFDCAQMLRQHLRHMRRPIKGWAGHSTYKSLAGGVKQLRKLGVSTLAELMDTEFERIASASARIGDVLALPGMEGPGALAIALGNGRVLCWVEDFPGAVVAEPLGEFEAAWRVMPGGAA